MSEQIRAITEDELIEYILRNLYSNLDKNELHLEKDILIPAQVQLDERQLEHVREILMSTQLVKASVGFGKNGFIYLTATGIQVLKQYKTYHNFLQATQGFTAQHTLQTAGPASTPEEKPASDQSHVNYDDMAH
jgi:hypothetical protein